MTSEDSKELISWLESRAQVSTMPGASRMYKLALDAIRAQPANDSADAGRAAGDGR